MRILNLATVLLLTYSAIYGQDTVKLKPFKGPIWTATSDSGNWTYKRTHDSTDVTYLSKPRELHVKRGNIDHILIGDRLGLPNREIILSEQDTLSDTWHEDTHIHGLHAHDNKLSEILNGIREHYSQRKDKNGQHAIPTKSWLNSAIELWNKEHPYRVVDAYGNPKERRILK